MRAHFLLALSPISMTMLGALFLSSVTHSYPIFDGVLNAPKKATNLYLVENINNPRATAISFELRPECALENTKLDYLVTERQSKEHRIRDIEVKIDVSDTILSFGEPMGHWSDNEIDAIVDELKKLEEQLDHEALCLSEITYLKEMHYRD